MKKYTGIVLLILLTVPFVSCYFVMKYQARQVRREVKHNIMAGMDHDELVLLSFTKKEQKQLNWKHSKEFEYQGQMYDIVEKEVVNDTTHFWCWWDHAETKLNKKLSHLVSRMLGKDPKRQSKQDGVQTFYKLLICSNHDVKWTLPANKKEFHKPTFETDSLSFPPPSPPPLFG